MPVVDIINRSTADIETLQDLIKKCGNLKGTVHRGMKDAVNSLSDAVKALGRPIVQGGETGRMPLRSRAPRPNAQEGRSLVFSG